MKPQNESNDLRVLEKLEIERVWWELIGVPFNFYAGNELTRIQSSNINWATHPLRTTAKGYSQYEIETALSLTSIGRHCTRDLCNMFVHEIGVDHEEALNLFRFLIACKHLTVDISYTLETLIL